MSTEALDVLKYYFTEAIPFNRHLGLMVDELRPGHAVMSIAMKPAYIGDLLKGILHGGIISTLVDVTGGLTAFSVLDWPRETSVNTIDMRVDYVRMGKGERFTCRGEIIRKGNRIVVTRTEVKDDQGHIIGLGTATYNIFSNPESIPPEIQAVMGKLWHT